MITKVCANCFSRAIDRSLGAMELIGVIAQLDAEGEIHLVDELYRVWTRYNADDPFAYAIFFNYAVSLLRSNELASARDAWSESIRVNPDFFPSYFHLGNLLERLGELGAAIECWQKVVERAEAVDSLQSINPDAVGHRLTALQQITRLGLRWLQAQNWQEAIQWNPEATLAAQAMVAMVTEDRALIRGL